METMHPDVEKVLFSEEDIANMVKRLGAQISEDYKGKDLVLIAVLRGAVVFMGDLMRAIDTDLAIDFMAVSSYGNGTKTTGEVQIIKDIAQPIDGRDLLIVEDDPTLGEGIRLALQAPELRPQLCRSLADAGDLLSRRSFDLLILDINLPDGNGLDLLRALRRESEVPVILLTANDLETDIVAGLELGADDYITKPFSLAVLRARVNTQLRRTAAPQAERVQLDGFTFDFGRMEFSRNGVPVELSKTEQKLLRLLVEHRGQTLTRAALVDRIWTDGAEYVDENALSVTVKRLRDKLEDMPSKPRYIKTVYGLGYTWAVN